MLEAGNVDQAQLPAVLVDDDRAKVPAILVRDDDNELEVPTILADEDDGDDQAQVPAILRAVAFACVGVTIIRTVVMNNTEISWTEDLQLKASQPKHVIAQLFLILCSICVLWIAVVCCVEACQIWKNVKLMQLTTARYCMIPHIRDKNCK